MPGSRVRIEQIAPSREVAPGYESINQPRPFQGSNVGPAVPIQPEIAKKDSIFLIAGVGCETQNLDGEEITLVQLDSINANLNETIYVFPGEASDFNTVQWKFPVPSNMRDGSPLTIRLHLLGEPTAVSPPTPGGNEVFTGAKFVMDAASPQSIPDDTNTQVTSVWDNELYDTDEYWDALNGQFEIPVGFGGHFLVQAGGCWDNTAFPGGYGYMTIRVNGSVVSAAEAIKLEDQWYYTQNCSFTGLLNDGDTVSVWVRQTTGGAYDFTRFEGNATFFSISRWDYTPP